MIFIKISLMLIFLFFEHQGLCAILWMEAHLVFKSWCTTTQAMFTIAWDSTLCAEILQTCCLLQSSILDWDWQMTFFSKWKNKAIWTRRKNLLGLMAFLFWSNFKLSTFHRIFYTVLVILLLSGQFSSLRQAYDLQFIIDPCIHDSKYIGFCSYWIYLSLRETGVLSVNVIP